LTVDRLAKGAVVLRATPESCGRRTDRNLRHGCDGRELSDLQIRACEDSAARCDRAVEVLPVDGLKRIAGVRTAAPVRAEPDAAVRAAEDVRRVARIECERVEVRVLVPAEVLPRRAAVVGAEDPARADSVIELTGREDDVR